MQSGPGGALACMHGVCRVALHTARQRARTSSRSLRQQAMAHVCHAPESACHLMHPKPAKSRLQVGMMHNLPLVRRHAPIQDAGLPVECP